MIQLQYRHPITDKCTIRYFKTYEDMYKHLSKFNTFINYCFIDDEDEEPDFHYDIFLPEDFCWLRYGDKENV